MNRKRAQDGASPVKRRRLRAGMIVGSLLMVALCLTIRYYWGTEQASAGPQPRPSDRDPATPPMKAPVRPAAQPAANRAATLKVVATVNGEDVTREDLARECLRHYGSDVLERIVNKYLIRAECKKRNVTVSQQEVSAEIERMAKRFSLPVDHWLEMLEQERGIHPAQYAGDIIWPTLALRKLAGDQLQVTQEELSKEFEARFGPAVKARLIVLDDAATAEQIRARAAADPDQFGQLAKEHSVDVPSASANGLIQPIRRHMGHKVVEDTVFAMKQGDVSDVIEVGGQYVILKCEGHMPRQQVALEQVKMRLVEGIRDAKMRDVAGDVFRRLQAEAKVENVLNDPAKSRQYPGVAALINGQKIPVSELAEICIERHGEEVLEGIINRRLLEQACRSRKIKVTEKDLDEEITQAASLMVPSKSDGSPDVDAWLKLVTEEQNVSVDVYRRDAVWPSVALKKLVADKVQVTEEDLKKGFEANYGPRVRCLAIVLNNSRQALKVWEMARENLNEEHFGTLAEQYSVEAGSRALRGEVPPIQKHGGQPVLEEKAFAMQQGELSDIIQVGPDQFVILYCLGQTKPVEVDFASVKQYLHEDIFDKKLRVAMAEKFQALQDAATIDNALAGTSRSPKHTPTRQRASHAGYEQRVPLRR